MSALDESVTGGGSSSSVRNFRSYYYEKVGFRGVEEKKSLNMLLKEPVLEPSKLSQFCVRFAVPDSHRILVWKVLLGVLPQCQSIHEYVSAQRWQQYQDLCHTASLLGHSDVTCDTHNAHWIMFLMEEGQLTYHIQQMLSSSSGHIYISLSSSIHEMCYSDCDRYWISTRFYKYLDKLLTPATLHRLCTCISEEVESEDSEVFTALSPCHLTPLTKYNEVSHHSDPADPHCITWWCLTALSTVLPTDSIYRVWDMIIGGSCVILSFVCVVIILTHKRHILQAAKTSSSHLTAYLRQLRISDVDVADGVVSKAVEMWQQHGGALLNPNLPNTNPNPNPNTSPNSNPNPNTASATTSTTSQLPHTTVSSTVSTTPTTATQNAAIP